MLAVPATHAFGGTISGVVRDSAGNPIAGATVYTQIRVNEFNFPNFAATTDAAGSYSIAGLGPAEWKVAAFAPGFALRWGNAASFETAATVTITADESHTFDVMLPRENASITGTVTDPSGNPMAGVVVRPVYQGSQLPFFIPGFDASPYFGLATTDANGGYAIPGVAPAAYTVGFSSTVAPPDAPPLPNPLLDEWYLDSHDSLTATPIELAEGVETANIDAQLDLGATISGQVRDSAGNPLAGVSIVTPANLPFGGTVTDANGMYTLIGIPPGDLAYVGAFPGDPLLLPGWYGGANFDTATHLQVGLGQVIEGIDIQLPTPGEVNIAVFRPDGSLASARLVPCIAPGLPVVVPHPAPGFGPLVQCSSGGQVNVSGSATSGALRLPVGTYNALSAEGIGSFGVTTLNPSAVASFTLTADTPIDCVFNLGGAASCSPSNPATNDGDGLIPLVEDGAPNNGDGNADGIRDAEQSDVASLPAAVGGGYVTLVVPDGQRIVHAFTAPQSSLNQPFETGSIGVTIQGVPIGGTSDITMLRTSGGAASELWAFNNQTFQYAAVPAEFSGTTITAHITDGGVFDNTSLAGPFSSPPDGTVSVNVTPVIPDHTPPTITCPSPDPVFAFQQFPATIAATVTDSGSGVVIPPTFPQFPGFPVAPPFTQSINTVVLGPGSVTFTASDKVGNTATATCNYTVVDDGDGVPPSIESGDGNGDGIADAIQSNVATATNIQFGVEPVVIAAPSGTQLTNVSVQPPFFYPSPTLQTLDSGIVLSTITGFAPGQTVNIDLIQTAAKGTTFLQFTGSGWTPLPATFNESRVSVSVTDGGVGDGDFSVNGSILFSGAVATAETTPPVVDDGDGVPADVENAAPNNGDGNADGILDSVQSTVASVPTPIGGGYSTLVSAFGGALTEVSAIDFSGTPPIPSNIHLESGLYRYTVQGSIVATSLLRTTGSSNYVLFSPIHGNWQQVSVFISDGGFGDADGVVNGQVSYVVAPAIADFTPPSITCPTAPSFVLNQPGATLSASVFDGESGTNSATVSVPLSTSTVGASTVAVTATDLAGNGASAFCPYSVGVKLNRLISPNPALTTKVKAGRPVPIRWRAVDFNGRPVTDPNHFVGISVSTSSCAKGRDRDLDRVRDRGLRYLGNGQWEFDWTPPARKGCYIVQLNLVGASRTARIRVN